MTCYRLMKKREGILKDKRFPVLDFGKCHELIWKCKGGAGFVGKIVSSG